MFLNTFLSQLLSNIWQNVPFVKKKKRTTPENEATIEWQEPVSNSLNLNLF